ncbi:GspH/FimT family pseudopilin [endosymbiont of Lamellibrachia barhami]|uniref:GspH/FimT family pseudopilin n=1 Tax=endosymbiont of Lamellibrachia barhami TaxID=205975 RepID=UPI0015AC038B|nr:GspH/FimT family pseudopilin [endosymbiont of Lamellibrachia barhami]
MDVALNRYTPACTAGFTLPELLTTLSVALILLSAGVPAYRTLAANSQMSGEINSFISHLQLTRSTAIMTGGLAILCPSTDAQTCLDEPLWHEGFLLYADTNGNRQPDDAEKRIRYQNATRHSLISMRSTQGRRRIIYRPDGTSPGSNLTLTFCDVTENIDPRAVVVSNAGRPRISKTRPSGGELSCN